MCLRRAERAAAAVTSGGEQYSEQGKLWGSKEELGNSRDASFRPPPPPPLLASLCTGLEGPTFTLTSCLKQKSLFCFHLPVARRHLLYLFIVVAPAPNTLLDDNSDNNGTITMRARI